MGQELNGKKCLLGLQAPLVYLGKLVQQVLLVPLEQVVLEMPTLLYMVKKLMFSL
jgi:hypothetical protein